MAILDNIAMDFIAGMSNSRGYIIIMVVADRLSEYDHFLLLKCPITTKSVVVVFLKEVVLHGIPKSIVTESDISKMPFGES